MISGNDESNQTLVTQLKQEKQKLLLVVNENETKVRSLRVDIAALTEENEKLELQLKDRDILHEKLLKSKKLYENALRDLLSSKKEQNELEQTLKQKMFALNRYDGRIRALKEEKEHSSKQLVDLRTKYQREMNELAEQQAAELRNARRVLNAQQIKYDDMRTKHEALRENLLAKREICVNLKQRIDGQKASFQHNLEQLVAEHTRELESISSDTNGIKEMMSFMKDFEVKSGTNDKNIGIERDSRQNFQGHDMKHGVQLPGELSKDDLQTLGIWNPVPPLTK